MKNNEMMDKYLSGLMGADERRLFMAGLQQDPPVRQQAEQWFLTLRSLETAWISEDLELARKSWLRRRMFRSGLIIAGLCMLAGITAIWSGGKENPASRPESGLILTKDHTPESGLQAMRLPEKVQPQVYVAALKDSVPAITQFLPAKTDSTAMVPAAPAQLPEDTNLWPAQIFSICTDRDTLLQCSGGLKISLPAHLLADSAGLPVSGMARVEVTEYLSYYPMFLHRITTVSGGRLLQSGGSCRISVTQEGRTLSVLPGRSYQLYFPAQEWHPEMTTFFGGRDSSGELDWTLRPAPAMPQEDTARPGLPAILSDGMDGESITGFRSRISACPDEAGMKRFLLSFNRMNPAIVRQLLKDSQKLNLLFKYDDQGYLQGFDYVVDKKRYNRTDRRVMRFRRSLEPWRLNNVSEAGTVSVQLTPFETTGGPLGDPAGKGKGRSYDSAVQEQRDYHLLTADRFSFINCDFFKKGPFINATIRGTDSAYEVRFFFVRFNAAARATHGLRSSTLYNCPSVEPVVVIALRQGHLRKEMSITHTVTSGSMQAATWEPFSLEKIRQVLDTVTARTIP